MEPPKYKIGDLVKKKKGFKFIGTILALYWSNAEEYAVVELTPNEYSDGLQHIYKVEQLELIL